MINQMKNKNGRDHFRDREEELVPPLVVVVVIVVVEVDPPRVVVRVNRGEEDNGH